MRPTVASWPEVEPEKIEAVIAGILIRMKMFTTISSKRMGKFCVDCSEIVCR